MREQRIVLEHQADVALDGRQPGQVATAERDRARGRLQETGHQAQRRGLAAAAGAEQRNELALRDVKRQVFEHLGGAVVGGDRLECEGLGHEFTWPER